LEFPEKKSGTIGELLWRETYTTFKGLPEFCSEGERILVFGHSHKRGFRVFGKTYCYNTGGWVCEMLGNLEKWGEPGFFWRKHDKWDIDSLNLKPDHKIEIEKRIRQFNI